MGPASNDPYGLPKSTHLDYQGMSLETIRRRWDSKASRWDQDLADESFHLNEDGAYQRFLHTADEVVAERAQFCRRHLMVDLGCGTALVLEHLAGRFSEALGLDISGQMLAEADRRAVPNARYQEGNCFELAKFAAGAGAVFSRGILLSHYGPPWDEVLLGQIHQVLTVGGVALLDFLNAQSRHLFAANPDNKTYYSPPQLEELARRAGFGACRILGEPTHRVRMILLERQP